MYSPDLVLPIFAWFFLIVHIDFDSVEDGSRACKNCVIYTSSLEAEDDEYNGAAKGA